MKITQVLLIAAGLLFVSSFATAEDFGIAYQKHPMEGLIVGGQPTKAQLEALQAAGYSTVINLRRKGEFDEFDEATAVGDLGMDYVHIPLKNIDAIDPADAQKLHDAITGAEGPVFLHCTVGWRAGGLLGIERYLLHGASEDEALEIAAEAHMSHATGDVKDWIRINGR
jgi:uncharacterized protein (TIGR01244 family)